jgi:glycosyltransferase involved in cell wall biosynthesis
MPTFVIIPGYNEEKYLEGTLRGVKRHGFTNIVYADDGSEDRSVAIAQRQKTIVVKMVKNRGKGAALRTGCDVALRHGASKLIFMDADQQHDPEDLAAIDRLLDTYDLVYAHRDFSREMPFLARIGNLFFTATIRALYLIRIRDALSGYRGVTAKAYRQIRWESNGYEVEAEIIVRGAKAKLRHAHQPTRTIYHDRKKGTTPVDGLPILWRLVKWRFRRF